ncbi:MAG: hypothetical protein HYY50_04965 [Candidatus Kerfeldbacteria bacterium]|nr:hypothetical protein [Candidatus Kerfeldbacteria bacterium]
MRTHDVLGGELQVFHQLDGAGTERLIFRRGVRREADGLETSFAISYAYGPGENVTEYESMEIWRAVPTSEFIGAKYVVRSNTTQRLRLPLVLGADDTRVMVNGTLTTIGYTHLGGQDQDPREPWARFIIDRPEDLELAFGPVDASDRQPNDAGTFVVLKAAEGKSLMALLTTTVNGRVVTFTRAGEITVNFGPDQDGQRGKLLIAYLRKVTWREGGRGGIESDV